MMELLDHPNSTKSAAIFFDGNTEVPAPNLFSSQDTLVQAGFSTKQTISQIGLHWRGDAPQKEVRLEVQTSVNPHAWFSVANDDQLWSSSAARIGGTLIKNALPGANGVTSIYFPSQEAMAVRLLLTSFPNEVTEIQFFGP